MLVGPFLPDTDDLTLHDARYVRGLFKDAWATHVEYTPLRLWLLATLYAHAVRNEYVARHTYLAQWTDAALVARYRQEDLGKGEERALAFELRRRYGSVDEAIQRIGVNRG